MARYRDRKPRGRGTYHRASRQGASTSNQLKLFETSSSPPQGPKTRGPDILKPCTLNIRSRGLNKVSTSGLLPPLRHSMFHSLRKNYISEAILASYRPQGDEYPLKHNPNTLKTRQKPQWQKDKTSRTTPETPNPNPKTPSP